MIPYTANGDYLIERYYPNVEDVRQGLDDAMGNPIHLARIYGLAELPLPADLMGQEQDPRLSWTLKAVLETHCIFEIACMTGFIRGSQDVPDEVLQFLKREDYRSFAKDFLGNPLPGRLWLRIQKEEMAEREEADILIADFLQILHVVGEGFLESDVAKMRRYAGYQAGRANIISILSNVERVAKILNADWSGERVDSEADKLMALFGVCDRAVVISDFIKHLALSVNGDLGLAVWHLQRLLFGTHGGIGSFLLEAVEAIQAEEQRRGGQRNHLQGADAMVRTKSAIQFLMHGGQNVFRNLEVKEEHLTEAAGISPFEQKGYEPEDPAEI